MTRPRILNADKKEVIREWRVFRFLAPNTHEIKTGYSCGPRVTCEYQHKRHNKYYLENLEEKGIRKKLDLDGKIILNKF